MSLPHAGSRSRGCDQEQGRLEQQRPRQTAVGRASGDTGSHLDCSKTTGVLIVTVWQGNDHTACVSSTVYQSTKSPEHRGPFLTGHHATDSHTCPETWTSATRQQEDKRSRGQEDKTTRRQNNKTRRQDDKTTRSGGAPWR
eukprot:825509-Rhodomonas_salina.1